MFFNQLNASLKPPLAPHQTEQATPFHCKPQPSPKSQQPVPLQQPLQCSPMQQAAGPQGYQQLYQQTQPPPQFQQQQVQQPGLQQQPVAPQTMIGDIFGAFQIPTVLSGGVRLIEHPRAKAKPTDELIAVIVTICGGSSYDDMFRQVPQEGPEGTRIACYQVGSGSLISLKAALLKQGKEDERKRGDGSGDAMSRLCKDISEVDADSVVFNWECCSVCSERGFSMPAAEVMGLMQLLIKRGHMVMCSDFSLKALITEWTEQSAPDLGPNPLRNLGEFSGSFALAFNPQVLETCPSTQLQKVGDLCKDGKANVHALGGTIVYSVDKAVADNAHYKLEVLTVIPSCGTFNMSAVSTRLKHKIGGTEGTCGHVLLRYSKGGKLLLSAGHWIELVKLDVTEEALLRVAQQEYGSGYVQEVQAEMAQCGTDAAARKQVIQQRAAQMVQSSAPQEYSKGWGRSKAGYQGQWQQSRF